MDEQTRKSIKFYGTLAFVTILGLAIKEFVEAKGTGGSLGELESDAKKLRNLRSHPVMKKKRQLLAKALTEYKEAVRKKAKAEKAGLTEIATKFRVQQRRASSQMREIRDEMVKTIKNDPAFEGIKHPEDLILRGSASKEYWYEKAMKEKITK